MRADKFRTKHEVVHRVSDFLVGGQRIRQCVYTAFGQSKTKLRRWLKDNLRARSIWPAQPLHGRDVVNNEATEETEDTPAPEVPTIPPEPATPEPTIPAVPEQTTAEEAPAATCPDDLFTCDSGECALMTWRCDGDRDCDDGSDETGCPPPTCRSGFFMCANGQCIPSMAICDNSNDCGDGSDEVDCENFVRTCPPGYVPCPNTPSRCIRQTWFCDGDNDCGDRSDEANCTRTCPPSYFQCSNGNCVQPHWVCDGDNDCGDRSDEQNCPGGGGGTTASPTSCDSSSQFRCANGRCIPRGYVCDGDNDCGDMSDEQNCGSRPPPPGSCPLHFRPLRSGSSSCYRPVTAGLQWQSAADYCRALNPRAHLLVIDSQSELQAWQQVMEGPAMFHREVREMCPLWWTAGRRVDDSSIESPYVWNTQSESCGQDGCFSEFNVYEYWPSRGSIAVPEGQPACVAVSIDQPTLPWSGVPCTAHACTMCEIETQ